MMASILIVDDDPESGYMLRLLLEDAGFRVRVAADGEEALRAAEAEQPDLVLSDVLMPQMDGFALCRRWQRDPRLASIPFILYSGSYNEPEDHAFARRLGACALVSRADPPAQLLAAAQEALSGAARRRKSAPAAPLTEPEFLRQHNDVLVRRLEEEVSDLRETNRALEREVAERRRAQDELAGSRERFRTIMDSIDALITVTDPESGRLLFANAAAEAVWGRVQGQGWQPVRACTLEPSPDTALPGGPGPDIREGRCSLNGRWYHGSSRRIQWSDGRMVDLRVAIDITDRHSAEEQLARREADLCRAQEIGQIGIWFCDLRTGSVSGSEFTRRLFGIAEAPCRFEEWLARIHPDDRDRVQRARSGHSAAQRWQMVYRVVCDGAVRWITDHSELETDNGVPVRVVSAVRDFTEQHRALHALRDSEEKLRVIFNQTFSLMGLLKPDGTVLSINKTALEMVGAREEEVSGRPFWEGPWWTHAPELQERLRAAIQQAADGETARFEATHRAVDGTTRTIDFSLKPVRSAAGEVLYLNPEGRDITDIRRAQEERLKMEQQVLRGQKMEAIGTLAGGIAHDFNNMLNAIAGYTDLARNAPVPPDSRIPHYLDQVGRAADRARDLVRQILAFSRQSDHERRVMELGPLVKEVAKLLRASIPSTISMKVAITEQPLYLYADPTQLHQVLMNLCTNAFYAMRETGGFLSITLSAVDLGAATVAELPAGRFALLSVRDTGNGLSEEVRKRLFEPFFTTKPQEEGTGMGLAVTHGIVTGHGGTIVAGNAPSGGAQFDIYLPLSREPGAGAEPEAGAPARGVSQRVLFVDDEVMLVELEAVRLTELGYQVTAHTDARAALRQLTDTPDAFDVLITDQAMPSLTGIDLATRALEIRPDLPIILCTGYSDRLTPEQATSHGIRAYLAKPFSRARLAETLQSVLASVSGP